MKHTVYDFRCKLLLKAFIQYHTIPYNTKNCSLKYHIILSSHYVSLLLCVFFNILRNHIKPKQVGNYAMIHLHCRFVLLFHPQLKWNYRFIDLYQTNKVHKNDAIFV